MNSDSFTRFILLICSRWSEIFSMIRYWYSNLNIMLHTCKKGKKNPTMIVLLRQKITFVIPVKNYKFMISSKFVSFFNYIMIRTVFLICVSIRHSLITCRSNHWIRINSETPPTAVNISGQTCVSSVCFDIEYQTYYVIILQMLRFFDSLLFWYGLILCRILFIFILIYFSRTVQFMRTYYLQLFWRLRNLRLVQRFPGLLLGEQNRSN